jgi:hypothetical protein
MQHGAYIAEFEKCLFKHGYAISRKSLSELIQELDFSKLRDIEESDRFAFYEALVESIRDQQRGVEDGIQVLGENDATEIINMMADKAANRSLLRRASGTSGA